MKLTLVVALYLNPGRRADFERFESEAAKIMGRYGGALERRIVCPSADSQPDEVHIVTFPDEDSYARYRSDYELRTLADLRTRAIRNTVIWRGSDAAPL
jgi:antibiotic biosynthesis monooxygenase (ABM) superfamily enzyme